MNRIKQSPTLGKLLAFFMVLTLGSCSSDDEEKAPSNEPNGYELDGTFYELAKSFVNINMNEKAEGEAGPFYHEVILSSSGVSVDNENERFTATVGDREMVVLLLKSPKPNSAEGTYTYSTEGQQDYALVNGDMLSSSSPTVFDITGGTLTVEQEGNEIIVQFDLINENDQEITGNYSGEFVEYFFIR